MQPESIDSIRFASLSPAQIKHISVAKLIVPDTYNEDGYPIDGGLMDQRLGVIDPGLKCKTCGGRYKTCPGHFGHIELIRPVIHILFAKAIYQILQTTCDQCHRILLSENQANALPSKSRLEEALKKARNVKKCPYCEVLKQKLKFERPTTFYLNANRLKPDEIRDWLSKVSDSDLAVLGIDAKATRPEWFVLTTLIVPPVNVRPTITLETGERSEDDLTHKLVDVIRINQRLEQNIDAGAPQIIIDDTWELLQYHVTTYFNNETPGVPVARPSSGSSRPLKTLAQRLKGKEGRLRFNLNGKRVNFSARSVISVDTSLALNEVGVPTRIAEHLSVPFYVTHWNKKRAEELLASKEYPYVLNVIAKDGQRKRVTEQNRDELLKLLEPGQILERQLINGDIALFNRQPTLHRISIMAHRVKVLPGRTLRINNIATDPYNADFDGDEMNLHIPQTLEAQAEARYLMQAKDQILAPRNGMPIMFIDEDAIAGMYFLTKDGAYFTKEEASLMLAYIGMTELPKPSRNGMYSGKRIFSMLLPKDLDMTIHTKRGKVVIKKGELEEGIVDRNVLGSNGMLIIKLFTDYGHDFIADLMAKAANLALRVVYSAGLSISIRDYYATDAMLKERNKIISEIEGRVRQAIRAHKEHRLEALPGLTVNETYDAIVHTELASARELSAQYLNRIMTPENNRAFLLASIGARGDVLNMVQGIMMLGQQDVRGKRPIRGYERRVLPYFRKGSVNPRHKGFIANGFMEGLDPVQLYFHGMGARDSAAVKILITPASGYMYRRILNALQDFYVDINLSVKDASGSLIQTLYGGDGIDPTMEAAAKVV